MQFCGFMETIEIRDGWIVTYHGDNLRLLRNWKKDFEDSKLTLIESIVTVLQRRFEILAPSNELQRLAIQFIN